MALGYDRRMKIRRLLLVWPLLVPATVIAAPEPQARLDIVDRAIAYHGGDLYRHSQTELDVCSKSGCFHVTARVDGDRWAYTVSGKSGDSQLEVRSADDGLTVIRNGAEEVVEPGDEQRRRDWAMARVYFCFLPFRLNDPSVLKQDLGIVDWDGRKLHKVKVTFEAGTSTDADDEYMYWFDPETARLELFAYSYDSGGGGLRFRRAVGHRRIGGILFFDQENLGADGPGLSVDAIDADYVRDKMRQVSTVRLERIRVEPLPAAPLPAAPLPATSDNEQVRGRGEGKDNWWDALPRAAWSEFDPVEQSQPWFEVYRIRPGVLAIYEPGQFEEVISYLIVGSERALLFDTGLGIGDMRRLAGELTDKDVAVLNSHTHYDHVGGNHAFETVYGTDLDYTRRHERGRPHAEVAEFVGEGWIWKETPEGFSADAYASEPFTITRRVEDGQVISLGDVELEVLLTPGHAPDSLCLLDRERRLLFTGDTFYPATLYAHLPGSTFEDYERTAARLADLADAVDLVLPAHNEPTMPSRQLIALRDAFRSMRQSDASYVLTDGNREYDFGRFSILVSDPPPWSR